TATLQQLISDTMVRWAQESVIEDPELVRAMFVLLHRQYDGIGGLVRALPKTYTINSVSVEDTINLLASLGQIRSLLSVRMGKEEEKLMIRGLGCKCKHWYHLCTIFSCNVQPLQYSIICIVFGEKQMTSVRHLVRKVENKYVMFYDITTYLLLLYFKQYGCGESYQEYCPFYVNAVVRYLAGCGLQSCPLLISKGYPDIGWNPVEGERYLDFLRFAVFCNGRSVEENANVVVRLLIR
ncbi:RYR2 protein, partial [Chroicocephalus maculipennis]|nr:RYR2 protein [Chroicocephalus maculipennis]